MREITDIKEIHNILSGLLGYFDGFCKKNGLRYYLSNGSLLGAVKYGDFIPWDDDADIMMPREDYDRLLSLLGDINNGRYELLCPSPETSWRMPYSKLTDKSTVWNEGDFDFGAELGVSLDIFPIDRWRSNKFVAKLQATYCDLLKRMLIYSVSPKMYTKKRGIKKIILYTIRGAARLRGYKSIYRALLRRAERSKKYKSENVGCVVWTCHASAEVIPAQVFSGDETARLGEGSYPIPAGYDLYLRSLYGDYTLELPPEKQISNHSVKVWRKDD